MIAFVFIAVIVFLPLIATAIIYYSTQPKFKVGDVLKLKYAEEWESGAKQRAYIIAVGKEKYQYHYGDPKPWRDSEFDDLERIYEKVKS